MQPEGYGIDKGNPTIVYNKRKTKEITILHTIVFQTLPVLQGFLVLRMSSTL